MTDRRMTLLHLAAGTEGPITRPIRSSRLGRGVSVSLLQLGFFVLCPFFHPDTRTILEASPML